MRRSMRTNPKEVPKESPKMYSRMKSKMISEKLLMICVKIHMMRSLKMRSQIIPVTQKKRLQPRASLDSK